MQIDMLGNERWYAIRVKSRSEKIAVAGLAAKGIEVFGGVAFERRVWADRIRVIEMPLFPGYIFGRFDFAGRRTVEDVHGVASIVSFGNQSCAVDDGEIAALRKLVASGIEVRRSASLEVGSPVRVTHGPLAGTEGRLLQVRSQFRLAVSVTILHRSVSVEIDEALVEPLAASSLRLAVAG